MSTTAISQLVCSCCAVKIKRFPSADQSLAKMLTACPVSSCSSTVATDGFTKMSDKPRGCCAENASQRPSGDQTGNRSLPGRKVKRPIVLLRVTSTSQMS